MLWIQGLTVMLLVQGRGEMAVKTAVTAVLLHHIAMDTGNDCNVVSTAFEWKWLLCLQLLQFCYITLLWI